MNWRTGAVPCKFWIWKGFKTGFEKVFGNIWVIFTARLQRDLCALPLGERPVFKEVEDSVCFLMATHPSVQLLSIASAVAVLHSLCHWRSQRLWTVDAEAWSKLSVFCKAEVCFSAQSLIAHKELGRAFAPASCLVSIWVSFENFSSLNVFESSLLF